MHVFVRLFLFYVVFISSYERIFAHELAQEPSSLNSGSYFGPAASPSRGASMVDDGDALPLGQCTQPAPTPVNWESKYVEFLGRTSTGSEKTNGGLLGALKASCDAVRSHCSACKASLAAEISAFFSINQTQLQSVISGRVLTLEDHALVIEACNRFLVTRRSELSPQEVINFGQIISKMRELDANYNLENLPDIVMENYLKAYIWRHFNPDHSDEDLEKISSPCSHFFKGDLPEYAVSPKSILSGGWNFSMTTIILGCDCLKFSYMSPFKSMAYHPNAMILGIPCGRFTVVEIKELPPETVAAQVLECSRVEVQVYAIRDAIKALRPVIQDLLGFLK